MADPALTAFTPEACYPLALRSFGLSQESIPQKPEDGIDCLRGFVNETENSNLQNHAHDVATQLVLMNLELDFDIAYDGVMSCFRGLQKPIG